MDPLLAVDPGVVELCINHIALPPKLPGRSDTRTDEVDDFLIRYLLRGIKSITQLVSPDQFQLWDKLRIVIQDARELNRGGIIESGRLLRQLQALGDGKFLILKVSEQNAGVLIRGDFGSEDHSVIIDAFEASFLSHEVLAAESALSYDFPSVTVSVPFNTFADDTFQRTFCSFMESASAEQIKRFAAQASKGGSAAFESRETADPAMIMHMLGSLLEALGSKSDKTPCLRKRVKDEVQWANSLNPWRRSPFWLILRVGLSTFLAQKHGGEKGRAYYKTLLAAALATFLRIFGPDLDPETAAFVNAKLARRVAKLENERTNADGEVSAVLGVLFGKLGPFFLQTLETRRKSIEENWRAFKNSSQVKRPIGFLPKYARDYETKPALTSSHPYLQAVMLWRPLRAPNPEVVQSVASAMATSARFHVFASGYFDLARTEQHYEARRRDQSDVQLVGSQKKNCIRLAGEIETYLDQVRGLYNENHEQYSICVLTVMELWVEMDRSATAEYSPLLKFNTVFRPESLDVLTLPRLVDMQRLQTIQAYIQQRDRKCNSSAQTIFDDPSPGCFAEVYFDDSKHSQKLESLMKEIEDFAQKTRLEKESELKTLSAEYEKLQTQIAQSACTYSNSDGYVGAVHDRKRCHKCYLGRKAHRLKIDLFEYPTPADSSEAKAVIFELQCPEAYAKYRNATFKIASRFASAHNTQAAPKVLLKDLFDLQRFKRASMEGVSLASHSKSFIATHYESVRLPTTLSKAFGPKMPDYWFDFMNSASSGFPKSLRFAVYRIWRDLEDSSGRSSNEIISYQNSCPGTLNVHEWTAFQTICSGKLRRWPQILVEIGSSNLNFSSEAVSSLTCYLAEVAGPRSGNEPVRQIHSFLADDTFCAMLLAQISTRLATMSANYREAMAMNVWITLLTRMVELGSQDVKAKAIELLDLARSITLSWIHQLRKELASQTDSKMSHSCCQYTFWAALLCKRACVASIDGMTWTPHALQPYIEASIALQDALDTDPDGLPALAKRALVQDLKMAVRVQPIFRQMLVYYPRCFASALSDIWPSADAQREYGNFLLSDEGHGCWLSSTIKATPLTNAQLVHYSLLTGHLLVDNLPLGRLPAQHRENPVLQRLFGSQNLLVYPSNLPGMLYLLAHPIQNHQLHIGFRNDELYVRALYKSSVLEFIPSKIFYSAAGFDLPLQLIENCAHWLDVSKGVLDIRQQPELWRQKDSNWQLDLLTRLAWRRKSTLVCPGSPVFQRVAQVFSCFEDAQRLTLFQPQQGTLQVELRRFDLSFFVNHKSLLQCRELRSEIAPVQDCGTWYGLRSKLVLRNVYDEQQRSVIVPLGLPMSYFRVGQHVGVRTAMSGEYGIYTINDVLGRLECAAEPRLLYFQVLFHAATSYIVPDELTGLTGTESALRLLRSGVCQPWSPVPARDLSILAEVAKLSPRREYYPRDKKVMQTTSWNNNLTTAIQHDKLRPLVESIVQKSTDLSRFAAKTIDAFELPPAGDEFLSARAVARRRVFERPDPAFDFEFIPVQDMQYAPIERKRYTKSSLNVFECVTLLQQWPTNCVRSRDLIDIFQGSTTITGFLQPFHKVVLSDRLELDLHDQWGPLVQLCRSSEKPDAYKLMFILGCVTFNDGVDMSLIRAALGFAFSQTLKELDPPRWALYKDYRSDQEPDPDFLTKSIAPFCTQWAGDDLLQASSGLSAEKKKALKKEKVEHENEIHQQCASLVNVILRQWPCVAPELDDELDSDFPLINMEGVLAEILPEWQRMFQNMELSDFFRKCQSVMDSFQSAEVPERPRFHAHHSLRDLNTQHRMQVPRLSNELIKKAGPLGSNILGRNQTATNTPTNTPNATSNGTLKENAPKLDLPAQHANIITVTREMTELEGIVQQFVRSDSLVRRDYGLDLMGSLKALKNAPKTAKETRLEMSSKVLDSNISARRQVVQSKFEQIVKSFKRDESRAIFLKAGSLWPCCTPTTLLEQLRSTSISTFGPGMKESLVNWAKEITELQRLLRIKDARLKQDPQKEEAEIQNKGHTNWNVSTNTDWLLLEIDSNIMVRAEQIDVCRATIAPSSGDASVLQMSMGKGKSSTIVPMAVAYLTNSSVKSLVRVVVPRASLLQMAQLMALKVGRLLGRSLIHIPFSRRTKNDQQTVELFFRLHRECYSTSGIVIALPEHILSLHLSGLQRVADGRIDDAKALIGVESWIRQKARDIIDESDFSLAVRTQLIYPSGSQHIVDGNESRWLSSQAVLHLVQGYLDSLKRRFPRSIEILKRSEGFPIVYFLRTDVQDELSRQVTKDVLSGQIPAIPTNQCSPSELRDLEKFISSANVSPVICQRVQALFPDNAAAKSSLLLIRGLLIHRLLLSSLRKRWSVHYGLHPQREPVAVPYLSKGTPSETAEWGFVDMAILFTCLSFYYTGLSRAQLRQTLESILKADDPGSAYARLIQNCSELPGPLREWTMVNVEDEGQLDELLKHLRFDVAVIDFFMNQAVFPKHFRQFEVKLQASGWDLPISLCSERVTTGFSGTNDTKNLLPLTIRQRDLPSLTSTNAEVLTFLLQERNRKYVHASRSGRRMTELDLLGTLKNMNIRMLIDAGAFVLDMDNLQLAREWLRIDAQAKAAIYFDIENKACALYRGGKILPLAATPFANDLDECVVF